MIILPQWRSQQGSKIEGTVSAHSRFLFLSFHSFFSPVLYPSSFSLRPLLSVTPKSISRMPAGALWASGYTSIFGILSPENVSGGNGSGSFCRTRMLIWTKKSAALSALSYFFLKIPSWISFSPGRDVTTDPAAGDLGEPRIAISGQLNYLYFFSNHINYFISSKFIP